MRRVNFQLQLLNKKFWGWISESRVKQVKQDNQDVPGRPRQRLCTSGQNLVGLRKEQLDRIWH